MTANMVPVCNITSNMVSSGEVGSKPISFSAMMTWAELETGSSSANPWTMERMDNCREVMCLSSDWTSGGRFLHAEKNTVFCGLSGSAFYRAGPQHTEHGTLQFVHVWWPMPQFIATSGRKTVRNAFRAAGWYIVPWVSS